MYRDTATHTTLLARLADGSDGDAWHDFLDRYGVLIRGCCVRRGMQAADAEDVTQEVLLSLTKAMPGFRYDPSKGLFRSYLKTVVMNAISRKSRQNPAAARLSEAGGGAGEADAPTDEDWESEWRQYHMRRAMKQLESEFRESDRLAFRLYAVEGRAPGDVASELSISVESVYQIKSRIMRRLSEIIGRQVEDEG